MKIDAENMPPIVQEKEIQELQEEAIPQEPPEPPPPPVYKNGQVNISQGDMYLHDPHQRATDYARKSGYMIASCLKEALEMRIQGKKFITIREADIAARGNIDLNNELVVAVEMTFAPEYSHIVDDWAGSKKSVFELRAAFNRNIAVIKNKSSPADEVKKAAKANKKIAFALSKVKLTPWPEEEANGFHHNLCKPDFMTWDQYHSKMKYDPCDSIHNWEEILKEYEDLYAN